MVSWKEGEREREREKKKIETEIGIKRDIQTKKQRLRKEQSLLYLNEEKRNRYKE